MATVPTPALPLDPKPFYAYVGAGEAALTSLRERVVTLPEQLRAQVKDLPEQVKVLQSTLEKRYSELAARGEKIVAELRRSDSDAPAAG